MAHVRSSVTSGEVVADRFRIDELAGEGGMGTVYRAFDLLERRIVALKVVRRAGQTRRFLREARVLAEVEHENVVRYVAHGSDAGGQAYLVMEWLDGEPLSSRIGHLSIAEGVEIVRQAAAGLGVAHRRRIVHRDLKPDNLFLVDGRTDRVKLLDFGVALVAGEDQRMTRAGIPMGTVGYMSPEQARADRDIDVSADVFSLGCVLFECLAGRPAFWAEHVLTVLAKIVLDDAPRVSELCPDVPPGLDDIVAWMLSRDPAERPQDANAVEEALAGLELSGSSRSRPRPSMGLTRRERRMLSVVVVTLGSDNSEATLDLADLEQRREDLRPIADAHEARVEALANGAVVLVFASGGSARDQAVLAARAALATERQAPDACVVLATGFGQLTGRLPVGAVVERAGALAVLPRALRVDDVTAGLLPPRFELDADQHGLILKAERSSGTPARLLLGKPTPCVGRERELIALEAAVDESFEERVARAVLLTGPAGVGKSRIRFELLGRLAERSNVWIGRGDPMRAGVPLALLSDALRSGLGLSDAEPETARRRLLARVARHVAPEDRQRVVEFLAEMLGFPFADSVQLGAARRDAILMTDQVRRAWLDFVTAEAQGEPLLIVLEDVHWGDSPSLELVDHALRASCELPLCVLGVARPEVHDAFVGLWQERGVHEIRVRELPRRAATDLVRAVLGDTLAEADARALVERSGGNAFYLEELIRARAAGRSAEMPESVLAVVQERLDELEPEVRRVLRAASVFGQSFWVAGASALLDAPAQMAIAELVERELVSVRAESRLLGQSECVFRHALVRDSAYAMLTPEDRALGHRLAGDWLELAGESDAALLAEHFERGGAPERAAPRWLAAAASALEASDFAGAVDSANRGLSAGAAGELAGDLSRVLSEALRWLGRLDEAEQAVTAALAALPEGSTRFWQAAAEAALVDQRLGRTDALAQLAERELACLSGRQLDDAAAYALVRTALVLRLVGNESLVRKLLEPVVATDPDLLGPRTRAYLHLSGAIEALYAADLGRYLEQEELTLACFEEAGDVRRALNERTSIGYAYMELGAYAEARRELESALDGARRMGLSHIEAAAEHNLGLALAHLGEHDRAEQVERSALAVFRAQQDRRLEGAALTYLARILELGGQLERAESVAREALALVTEVAPPIRPLALATLASVLTRSGSAPEALELSREALAAVRAEGGVESGEAFVFSVYVRSAQAAGEAESARVALADARARLEARAAGISDPELRRRFLSSVPENAEILRQSATPQD